MKKMIFVAAVVAISFITQKTTLFAQNPVADRDVVDLATGSSYHTTLVAAIKLADLTTTLKGKGPFTVFAPNDSAFIKLSPDKLESLMKPENKAQLTKVLTYHVVGGTFDSKAVLEAIKSGGGKATLTTLSGGKLTASLDGPKLKIADELGNAAYVLGADFAASNGVVHVIDAVVMPKDLKAAR